jgi:hypothetical protein
MIERVEEGKHYKWLLFVWAVLMIGAGVWLS